MDPILYLDAVEMVRREGAVMLALGVFAFWWGLAAALGFRFLHEHREW